jgi:S1-C subfamily serine protease
LCPTGGLATLAGTAKAAIASLGIGSGLAGEYVATGLEDRPAASVATTPVTTATAATGTSGGSLAAVAAAVAPSVDGQSSGSIGVGFAIPGNRVEQVVNQLTGGVHTVSASTTTG